MKRIRCFISVLVVLLCLGTTAFAQISIKETNTEIKKVLQRLEQETDYSFFYSDRLPDLNKKVTITEQNSSIENILNTIFSDTGIGYSIRDNKQIALFKKNESAGVAPAQDSKRVTIKGVVQDVEGEMVIGATIRVKNDPSRGAITNIDGEFVLPNVEIGEEIEVTSIGYTPQLIKLTSKTPLKIVMQIDTQLLDEVVVVGYGTQKKENLTGAVSAVNFDDINNIPIANTSNLLQGRLPGVVLTTNGAQAGKDNPEIRIRGIGTFGNNNPMVLIDGVESSISQIADVSASDIESVSVLKDAASAAIYGVRAANGVILITTKRGSESTKPTISYDTNFAVQMPTVLPDFVNSYEWAKMWNEANPTKAYYTPEILEKLKSGSDPDHFANTNWAQEMFRSAPMHQHHLSVQGGNKMAKYMISAQYFNQEGILKHTANERISFRSNLDMTLDKFTVGMNLSGSKQTIDEPVTSVTGGGLMRYLTWFTRPTVPAQYSNGHYGYVDGTPISESVFKNPLHSMTMGHKENYHYRFDGKAFVEFMPIKSLKLKSSLAYKFYFNDVTTFNPKNQLRYNAEGEVLNVMGNNTLQDYLYRSTTYINENIVTYNLSMDKHRLDFLAGHSIQGVRSDVDVASKQTFPTDTNFELDAGTENPSVSGSAQAHALQSFFGRINYNYDDKYLLELNLRHDGSSRMPKSHRYATFPSFSFGWLINNESFMKDISWLSLLKLRASWGKLGNQEIANYMYQHTYKPSGNYYFGDSKNLGLIYSKIPNDEIRWETTVMTDFGLDASFWQGRVAVTFDWYNKISSDILMALPMPGIFLGNLPAPTQNAGKVQNKGWELVSSYRDNYKDWGWNVGFSLSGVKNKILDMKGEKSIGNNVINMEGYPIGSFYGLNAIGIYRDEADLKRVNAEGKPIKQFNHEPRLGDIMYEDIDNDGNINDNDRVVIGNPFPKLQYSFNLGFSYKRFELNTFWQGVSGVQRYNWEEPGITNGGNRTTRWLDRWSPENPNGTMPVLSNHTDNGKYSSFWLTDGSYLRLKSLDLGYRFNIPQSLRSMGIKSLRVYISGSNLLTFTPLKNYDPEKTSGDSRNDVHPNAKVYSVGLNVKF